MAALCAARNIRRGRRAAVRWSVGFGPSGALPCKTVKMNPPRYLTSRLLLAPAGPTANGDCLDLATLLLIPALLLLGGPEIALAAILTREPGVTVITGHLGKDTAREHLRSVNRNDRSSFEPGQKLQVLLCGPLFSANGLELLVLRYGALSHAAEQGLYNEPSVY